MWQATLLRQMNLMIAFQAVGEKEDDDDREGNETHTEKQQKTKIYIPYKNKYFPRYI